MASQTKAGTAFLTDGTGAEWANPTYASADDSNFTTVTVARRVVSDTSSHVSYHFDFTIPSDATIDGIKLRIKRKATIPAGGSVNDNNITLTLDAASPYGSTSDSNTWTSTDTFYTWGGATEMWGQTFTPAQVNDDNFGAMFSAVVGGGTSLTTTAYVNFTEITVYYTEAVSSFTATSSLALSGVGI